MSSDLADSEWMAFIAKLEAAEEVQGRPAAFQALWSHADDVTLCGGFGGPEPSTQELRATMVFRREPDGWRIVHRHADLQVTTRPPQ